MRGFVTLTALVLAGCAASYPQPVAVYPSPRTWPSLDTVDGKSELAHAQRLAAQFPDSVAVRRGLLAAQLAGDDAEGVRQSLAWLKARGYVFTPAGRSQVIAIASGMGVAEAGALLLDEAIPLKSSRRLATVPSDALLVESVARLPRTGALWVSSIVSRSLFTDGGTGKWRRIEVANAGALGTIAFDPLCDCLWATSGIMTKAHAGDGSFRGVIAFDPVTGLERGRAAAPPGSAPSDMAVGGDGTVYASDPHQGGIFRLRPGEAAMEVLVAPGTFRSPQGLAVSDNGQLLYLSDYGYGIAIVNLRTGEVTQLSAREGVAAPLDGVDGLWRYGRNLIAVQNGQRPFRITALRLAEDGRGIEGAVVLERANPAWTEPLGGSVDGDRLIYVATGQWENFDEAGQFKAGQSGRPTDINLLPLPKR